MGWIPRFTRRPPAPQFSKKTVIEKIEQALALKGAAWAAFQLGADLRQAQIEFEIPEPRVHGISMSELMKRAAVETDTEALAEHLADLVFVGRLNELAADGEIPAPAEAVKIYLENKKKENA